MALEKDERLKILSVFLDRLNLAGTLGSQYNGDRDMYEILGYPTTISFEAYAGKYARQDIAGRIVDLPAIDTWQHPPMISDGDSTTDQDEAGSAFVLALQELIDKRKLWHYLQRVDRLAGIGQYGVLVLGLRGGLLSEPVGANSLKGIGDVLYFSSYSENNATIKSYVSDTQSERYDLPETYEINFRAGKQLVNWSRVIHVAEDLLEDDVNGRPRLERVYNLLEDLLKVVGGGAETNWKVMDRGLQADIREGFTGDAQALDDLEDEIDEYLHGLRRFIRTQGVDIKDLGAQSVDPSGIFEIIVSLIGAATGIPKRILLGSERGELASNQDQASWAGVIKARQEQYAEPLILRPLIDRLIEYGALPEPESGKYTVSWPSLLVLSDKEKAETAAAWATAIATAAPAGQADLLVPPQEFRETYLELPAESPYGELAVLDEEDSEGDNADDDSGETA